MKTRARPSSDDQGWRRNRHDHPRDRARPHTPGRVSAQLSARSPRLCRAPGVLAGVCAGLGQRFGLDPWPARLLFVLILLIVPGSQLLIYPLLWILMPNAAATATFRPVTPENETASAA